MAGNKPANGNYNRQKVEVVQSLNTDRLYGTLDEAISYLQEVKAEWPEASIHEHWTGYEDMELRFLWYRDETDTEMDRRIKLYEERQAQLKEDLARKAKKDKRRKQYESLKKEFGPW